MISVSLIDLLPTALHTLPPYPTFLFFLVGLLLFILLTLSLPPAPKSSPSSTQFAHVSGLLTALTLFLHNLPEGVAVALASLNGLRFALPLAIAIALHNIPEGMAVAAPLLYATSDRAYALRIAVYSALAEPAAVVLLWIIIGGGGAVGEEVLAASMAGVAGVMIALSVGELMPQAIKGGGIQKAMAGLFAGVAVMAALLRGMEQLGLGV